MADIVAEKEKKDTLLSFKDKKKESLKVMNLYEYDFYKQMKIQDCSHYLSRETWEHVETKDIKERFNSKSCQLRFCPICSWRKSLKTASVIYSNLSKIENCNFLFLTLTLKNCEIFDLKDTLKLMSESFSRMRKTIQWQNSIKGFIRALEITVADDGKMHPHFHILLHVNQSYLKHKKTYITQKDFTDLWQNSLKVDYKPIVDIRLIKPKNDTKDSLISAVAETIKYTLKSSDLLKMNKHTFPLLDLSMRGVKTINCGGSLLHVQKIFKDDEMKMDEWILLAKELFKWERDDYVLLPNYSSDPEIIEFINDPFSIPPFLEDIEHSFSEMDEYSMGFIL
jgi:plasmid rolling circle replication initiator protein Rep